MFSFYCKDAVVSGSSHSGSEIFISAPFTGIRPDWLSHQEQSPELAEIQKVLGHPHIKLQRPTETCWLSLENAFIVLRRSHKPVASVLEQEAAEGDATALGLKSHMTKPEFIPALHFLSAMLATMGALSVTSR